MKPAKIRSLRFENVSFSHAEGAPILDQVSFEFPMECNVWLSGDSGSGKSSVVKLMAALLEPQTGKYWVNDLDVTNASFEEFLPYRVRLGYATDYGGLLSNKTLAENILLPVMYHKGGEPEAIHWAEHLIEIFELKSFANIRPATVTGANRKMTAVARAFSLKPEVLFLDNPTEGIDRKRAETLAWLILQGRKEGWLKHVFIAGSDPRLAEMIASVRISITDKRISFASERKVA